MYKYIILVLLSISCSGIIPNEKRNKNKYGENPSIIEPTALLETYNKIFDKYFPVKPDHLRKAESYYTLSLIPVDTSNQNNQFNYPDEIITSLTNYWETSLGAAFNNSSKYDCIKCQTFLAEVGLLSGGSLVAIHLSNKIVEEKKPIEMERLLGIFNITIENLQVRPKWDEETRDIFLNFSDHLYTFPPWTEDEEE